MKIRLDPLDKLFSQLVRLRDGGICQYCGKKGTQTSHFHSRRKRSTRLDLDNACWLCFSCHRFLDEHPNKHTEFFKKRLGSERFEELNIRSEVLIRPNKDKIKTDLQDKIALLKGDND